MQLSNKFQTNLLFAIAKLHFSSSRFSVKNRWKSGPSGPRESPGIRALALVKMKDAPQEIRTFFITSVAHGRNPLFKKEDFARLFLNVLEDNRKKDRFLLHEFVVMPDHFHLIITPATDVSLEKAVQYIKGGFSFRAKKELGLNSLVWQEGFTNHRIRDSEDYERHREYIHQNPVKAGLVATPSAYPYSSAFPGMELDPTPQGLKPIFKEYFSRP